MSLQPDHKQQPDPDIKMWSDPILRRELEQDEGREARLYRDSGGNYTIAVGRNLSSRGMSNDEIDYLLTNDITIAVKELDRQLVWWRELPPAAQRVYINLCFNMGWTSFSKFHAFHADMESYASTRNEVDLKGAISELQDSLWWGQVGTRGPRMIDRLIKGHYADVKGNDNAV